MRDIRNLLAAMMLTWPIVVAAMSVETIADKSFVPLTEMGATEYRGKTGGLYGDGRNEPPAELYQQAKKAIAKIQPRDRVGKSSVDGKIVLLSIGMSNTTQEFSAFVQLANQDRRKRPELVLVDGAQGGADATVWAGGRDSSLAPKVDPCAKRRCG